ncbi:MAG: SOS response-associated peptidase family protein [Pseudomonadota bacterium]
MCANYIPVTNAERLLHFFGVVRAGDESPRDVFPSGLAPFIRLAPEGTDPDALLRTLADGIFRFVPDFIAKEEWARHTQNVRSETVHSKSTFKRAWLDGQRCIVPAESIYEFDYASGEAVRCRIQKANGDPIGIAGVYRSLIGPDGKEIFAFSMLTVNADDHPFMKQFHAPGEEKRMVVILEPEDFEGWLTCPVSEAKERYCKQWHGELVGEPKPLPKRPKKVVAPVPEPEPPTMSLLDLLLGEHDEQVDAMELPPVKPKSRAKPKVAKQPKQPPEDPEHGVTGDLF